MERMTEIKLNIQDFNDIVENLDNWGVIYDATGRHDNHVLVVYSQKDTQKHIVFKVIKCDNKVMLKPKFSMGIKI